MRCASLVDTPVVHVITRIARHRLWRNALLAFALSASCGQGAETGRIYRIGFLSSASADHYYSTLTTEHVIEPRLRELGYVEGRNAVWIRRFANGDATRLQDHASELAAANLDVVISEGTPATQVMQKATDRIPIVAVNITDPIASKMSTSLARPSANVTGITNMGYDIVTKKFDIVRAMVPGMRRVALFFNSDNPANVTAIAIAARLFRESGIEPLELGIKSSGEIEAAFRLARDQHAEAVNIPNDGMFNEKARQVAQLALTYRVPTVGGPCAYVKDGGLASFSADLAAINRLAANHVDRVLKGEKPANLPFIRADKSELCLNRRTARLLGVTIPDALLISANLVVD